MLLRAGPIPSGDGWAFEIKYDGFRAVSTEPGLEARSRRAWKMTALVTDLADLPPGRGERTASPTSACLGQRLSARVSASTVDPIGGAA